MNKLFIPRAHAKNIYEIEPTWFKKHNFITIFLDLDNTLDSYKAKVASDFTKDYIKQLLDLGLDPIILSNNRKKRVKTYADSLGIKFVNSIGKPFVSKLNKYIKENNIDKSKSVIIGDQTVTDIPFGNKAKIFTILTDKLVKEDQITTRFNRLFDIPRRKRLAKLNLLIDWRNI